MKEITLKYGSISTQIPHSGKTIVFTLNTDKSKEKFAFSGVEIQIKI